MTTLEQFIAMIGKTNFRVNNLFQREDRTWQANVTDGINCWGFGKGKTPLEALQKAWSEAGGTIPEEKQSVVLAEHGVKKQLISLLD